MAQPADRHTRQPADRHIVLVHGAWHGAWCWAKVLDGLAQAGVAASAVDLPLAGLAADAAVVRETIAAIDGPVIVLGHSYGGAVISLATAGATNVAHLVYLCAFQLEQDETTAAVMAAHPSLLDAAAMRFGPAGRTVADELLEPVFYADCSPADVALARARLRPMPSDPPPAPAYRPAWRDHSSTYVVCHQDRAISPDAQVFMAARAGERRDWDCGHSPFLSRPELVVGLLCGLARRGD